ncbi:hypothetical protein BDZ91DRAFT_796479 [Kalaharituber pfeilii]|nr:hypothetical protein BDZ91DRAFT_796479 [Kalaharituber pfeilii]
MWGAEIGWRGQKEWRKEMERIQYQILRKATGAVHGAARQKVNWIVGVECAETALDAAQARFVARSMGDPSGCGDVWSADFRGEGEEEERGRDWKGWGAGWATQKGDGFESVAGRMQSQVSFVMPEGVDEISWGGECVRVEVAEVELEGRKGGGREGWEASIFWATQGGGAVYTDGSMIEKGRDGEVKGMRKGIEKAVAAPVNLVILTDSQAAIAAVRKAGRTGKARTGDLKRVMEMITERKKKGDVKLMWVKAHIGIAGNEAADVEAKKAADRIGKSVVTEGGLRQKWKKLRAAERREVGYGGGSVMRWGRGAATAFTRLRTGKGMGKEWEIKIGKAEEGSRCECGQRQTADHLAFRCDGVDYPEGWEKWEDADEKKWVEWGGGGCTGGVFWVSEGVRGGGESFVFQGAARVKVEAIAGVESVTTILDQGQARYALRSVRDPTGVGDLWPESFSGMVASDPDREGERGRDWRDFSLGYATDKNDGFESAAGKIASTLEVDEEERVSWGRDVHLLQADIEVIDLKLCKEDTPAKWEKAINEAKSDSVAISTDGSRSEEGGVGGGWCWRQVVAGESEGSRWVGTKATVWDGEVSGMKNAVEAVDGSEKVLLLADSQAAISAVQKAGKTGKARTADLARVIELIAERRQRLREADAVKLAWVKAHVGIEGNEKADELAKEGAKCMRYDGQATEGGLRQELVRKRKEERERAGFGKGKFVKWGRRALTNYTWLRTGKGGAMWRRMVSGEEVQCTCGEAWSAEHVVFRCTELERPQRKGKDGAHVT